MAKSDAATTLELFDPEPYRDTWLTKAQLAQRIQTSERTIERRVKARIWPCHRDGRNVLRFTPADVAAIEARMSTEEPEAEIA